MSEVNRRETDAQVLRLFFISVAVFIVIGAIVYGVFQTEKLVTALMWLMFFSFLQKLNSSQYLSNRAVSVSTIQYPVKNKNAYLVKEFVFAKQAFFIYHLQHVAVVFLLLVCNGDQLSSNVKMMFFCYSDLHRDFLLNKT